MAFSAVGFEVGSGRKSCKRPIDDPLTITFGPESQDASKQCLLFIRTCFRSTPLHGWLDGHGTETLQSARSLKTRLLVMEGDFPCRQVCCSEQH